MSQVLAREQLPTGGEEECEIRGCCIVAVERIKECLHQRYHIDEAVASAAVTASAAVSGTRQLSGSLPKSLQIDMWLLETGRRSGINPPPHHRTQTKMY